MSFDEIKLIFQNFKKNPKKATPYLIVAVACFILGSFSSGYFSELGRQWASAKAEPKSVKMEMPVDEKMQYTPYNVRNETGGRFVGTYVSSDTVAVTSSQQGDASNLKVIPSNKLKLPESAE